MNMKFKRVTSALLAAAMLVPSTCIASYAAETDEAMTRALTYVKHRVEIPENLTGFYHNTSIVGGNTKYGFKWHTATTETGDYEELGVDIIGKVITYFDNGKMEYGDNYKFAKLEPDELYKKAKEAVEKLNPTVYKYIEISETPSIPLGSNFAKFSIKRVKDGVPVAGSSGNLFINKDTGEILRYNLNWIIGAGFAETEDAVPAETAQKGFADEFPVELVYTTEYDWETDKVIPHLIYRQTKTGEIDALTGKLSTYDGSYIDYDKEYGNAEEGDDDYAAETAMVADVTFTESELEKLELEEKLIKPDEAIKIVQDMGIFNIPDTAESTYSSCDYDDYLGAYVRHVSFGGNVKGYVDLDAPIVEPYEEELEAEEIMEADYAEASATTASYNPQQEKNYIIYGSMSVNAETGEILKYSCSNTANLNATKLKTESGTDKILAARFKKIAGDKAELFPMDSSDITYSREYISKERRDNGEIGAIFGASASLNRFANGIKCSDETARISIDRNGKVNNYNMTYYGIEYPEPDNIISETDAYAKFFEQVDFPLRYRCALKDNKTVVTALVYTASRTLYIDAFTGKLTNGDGSEAYIIPEDVTYTDLKDSKYRKIAEKLAAYDITVMDEDGSLNEDKIITRGEFKNLVRSLGTYSWLDEKETDKPLTRQYAAKIIASNWLGKKIAEMPIFKSSFSDVKDTGKYTGYIEVACNMGYMSGKDGKFKPAQKVTRGQALKMIYDLLNK